MVKPQYIFGSTLHKFLYIIFPSKIKLLTAKEKPINVSLQFFRTAKKSTIDRNINFHHITLTFQYLVMQKTARTVAPQPNSSFQTKDPIHCQINSGIIYKYILLRVMINEITVKRFKKNGSYHVISC